ncbi:MAG: HlyD family efflux transporter periplasmic adaptor subunit [Acidobacteria bacterium]|nr:HlyD family efflux transporter periplasmic adaptor subunit [Acidobacteriota bacterium]
MKLPKNRYLYILGGLVLVLILGYFMFFRSDAVLVEAGSVTRGELISSIDAEGRTRYHERFVVTAPVSGKMYRIQLHEGDRVPKGYVLTRIDPAPPRPLDPSRVPEPEVFPFAYNVYVPADGILTKIFVTSEGIVQAGSPIAEVSKPSQLEVVADLLSADATLVRPNMPVLITNRADEAELKAKVRNVEPQAFTKVSSLGVEEQRVNVIADLVDPPERLGDNYRVDIRIVVWEGKDVLRVPASALFRSGEEWQVFVIEGSKARTKAVEIGHRSPSFVEVRGGLAEGDTVILHPPNSVAEGTRVSRTN